jgi:hypothetical protein
MYRYVTLHQNVNTCSYCNVCITHIFCKASLIPLKHIYLNELFRYSLILFRKEGILCNFLFILTIVLSVLLRLTDSDIFKLSLLSTLSVQCDYMWVFLFVIFDIQRIISQYYFNHKVSFLILTLPMI